MKPDGLKVTAFRAVTWTALFSMLYQVGQLAIGILLARLLMPEDFGLLAMLALVLAVSSTLAGAGFQAALVQRPVLSDAHRNSAFYVNLGLSVLLALLLTVAGPAIADFFAEPILARITPILAVLFPLNALCAVQQALLTRSLKFRQIGSANVGALLIGGLVAVPMAWFGYGVWSLVAQQLSVAVANAILLWAMSDWRPAWQFDSRAARELFQYGSRMMAAGLVNQVGSNLYGIVIGRVFGAADLGFYSRAMQVQQLPSQGLGRIVSRVAFPLFASVQSDLTEVRRGVERSLEVSFMATVPVMVGLAVLAEPAVGFVLTHKWLPAVPYLQLLCILGVLYPLHLINVNTLMALGRSDLFLRLEWLKQGLAVGNVLLTWRYGIVAMIIGQIICSFIALYLNTACTRRLVGLGMAAQLKLVAGYAGSALIAGGTIWASTRVVDGELARLLAGTITGATVYVFICAALRLRGYRLGVEWLASFRARGTREEAGSSAP